MYDCPFCNKSFKTEAEKYQHVPEHDETWQTIENNIKEFPYIKQIIGSDTRTFFNPGRETHQFISVVLNGQNPQYKAKLCRLNFLLETYSDRIIKLNPNLIKTRARSDFFTFFSEMELLHGIVIAFNQFPEVPWKNSSPDVDFVLPSESIAIELKTPIGTNQNLSDYVVTNDNQKQLMRRDEEIKLLVIDTTFSYPDFPICPGGLNRCLNGKNIEKTAWNCLITFNTFHQKSDIYFKHDMDKTQKSKLNTLSNVLYKLWTQQC